VVDDYDSGLNVTFHPTDAVFMAGDGTHQVHGAGGSTFPGAEGGHPNLNPPEEVFPRLTVGTVGGLLAPHPDNGPYDQKIYILGSGGDKILKVNNLDASWGLYNAIFPHATPEWALNGFTFSMFFDSDGGDPRLSNAASRQSHQITTRIEVQWKSTAFNHPNPLQAVNMTIQNQSEPIQLTTYASQNTRGAILPTSYAIQNTRVTMPFPPFPETTRIFNTLLGLPQFRLPRMETRLEEPNVRCLKFTDMDGYKWELTERRPAE
jgi:hypothetical protein